MENLQKTIDSFNEKLEKIRGYNHAITLMHWDIETEIPRGAVTKRAEILGSFSGEVFKITTSKEFIADLEELEKNIDSLDEITKKVVILTRKEVDKLIKIPLEDYVAFSELTSNAQVIWESAKKESDFSIFAPYLEKIINYNKKFVELRGYKGVPYNTLLGDYEEGITTKELDQFFNTIKEVTVPLIKEIKNAPIIEDEFIKTSYDIVKQKEFCKFIAEYIGFDFNRGVLKESVHPFTLHFNRNDVRITCAYHENNVFGSISSATHEGGHAIYEQGVREDISFTPLGTGTSLGIHESQSRFFENIIGRSIEFWEPIYPKLVEMFPEHLSDIPLEKFWRAINKVTPSFIRVEADELTYNIHVLIRYEIEKEIFGGNIDINELPKLWDDKYEEYLGIRPAHDSQGILQDVHWSGGMLGYFPTYSLGNAYSAQMYNTMKKDLDIPTLLKHGDIETIKNYLNEKVHQYGSLLSPKEIIKNFTGEELNPKYLANYLVEKYTTIYNL